MVGVEKRWKRPVCAAIVGTCSVFLLYFSIKALAPFLETFIGHPSDAAIWGVSIAVGIIFALFVLFRKKRRYKGIENGSSDWISPKKLCASVSNADAKQNILLSKNVRIDLQAKNVKNDHVLILGGSGTGKSFRYMIPNIMQMNASYIITDPKGELLARTGKMLEERGGYKIKVFNVKDFSQSMHFNPFQYFDSTTDILRFIDVLMANTSDPTKHGGDPFWDDCTKLLLQAFCCYLQETLDKNEQTIPNIIYLLENEEVREDDEEFQNAVDLLFEDLAEENPSSFAVAQYRKFKLAAGKTMKSILISVAARLYAFSVPEIQQVLSFDEMDIEDMREHKTALFLIIDDSDTTYNFLVAVLIDTIFRVLVRKADKDLVERGSDGVPVRCLLDEIANIGKFPKLEILIATLRSRHISLEMCWQNVDQGKAIYDKHWPTIEGNCETTLFLGGKGEETEKYVSKVMLGQSTIETVSYTGSSTAGGIGIGSYGSNQQNAGRALLDETEVARIADDECLISIRGHQPCKDAKIETWKLPNYKYLSDKNPKNTYRFRPNSFMKELEDSNKIFYITDLTDYAR